MNKILLIIQREYFSRVKKKSFIWMTILVPTLFIGMYALAGYLIAKGDEMGEIQNVLVIDENGSFKASLKNTPVIKFSYSDKSYTEERKAYFESENYDYILRIPSSLKEVQILGEKKPSAMLAGTIEGQINELLKNKKLRDAGIDPKILADAEKGIDIEAKQITANGDKDAGTSAASILGLVTALLVYMSLFIYGTQVMRGVIEEKTSRIIEVVISSVKPFQLMLGKIIGVGLVGLTQFALWIVISAVLTGGITTMMAGDKMKEIAKTEQVSAAKAYNTNPEVAAMQEEAPEDTLSKISKQFESVSIPLIVFSFLFYFLFGYFLYSAVFAAVGSAVDNETETQQFMLPITLPLVFTLILSMSYIINSPDSPLAVWLSIIPFTSPIAMMIRIPFGVPAWQLILSMVLMVGGFLFTTWVAARIYRVGILMYGKKASYKELAKWFFYKE